MNLRNKFNSKTGKTPQNDIDDSLLTKRDIDEYQKGISKVNSAVGNELELLVQKRLSEISKKEKRLFVLFEKPEIEFQSVLDELKKKSKKEILCFKQVKKNGSKIDFLIAKGRSDDAERALLLIDCKSKDFENAKAKKNNNENQAKNAIRSNNAAENKKLRKDLMAFDSNMGLFLYNTKEIADICKPVKEAKVDDRFFAISHVDELLDAKKTFEYLEGLLDGDEDTVSHFFQGTTKKWKTLTDIRRLKVESSSLSSYLAEFENLEKTSTCAKAKDYAKKLGEDMRKVLIEYVKKYKGKDEEIQYLIQKITEN